MKVLRLTLKRKWFDMILSGEKKEEYREIKSYWESRLLSKQYDAIEFVNGYHPDSPRFTIKLDGITINIGKNEWGAPNTPVFILKLGNLL